MRHTVICAMCLIVLLFAPYCPADAERVMGEVYQVSNDVIVASFPVPVHPRALMTILKGDGDSVAGLAIAQKCNGDAPPYDVTGALYFTMDAVAVSAGKKVYVNSFNAGAAPSSIDPPAAVKPAPFYKPPSDQDLKLYYYAAGQTVGYGAFGLGYERSVRLYKAISLELDGGVTGVGNLDSQSGDSLNADQLIKSLNGRLRVDLCKGFAVYTGYRWNQARGDDEKWETLVKHLGGTKFDAASDNERGIVQFKGMEYGFIVRPFKRFSVSAGYIPEYISDYGTLGVIGRPAYSGEVRFGGGRGAVRFRGITTTDYWLADMGVTIR
ncbi:hypothetical protein LLG46_00975 [bacterium]|nr:hypothetical protein [bacterium]